jgi:TRAP transporter TAXI family solute receptor
MGFSSMTQVREYLWVIGPVVLLILGTIWAAFQFVEPAPPRTLVMSTGSESGGYHAIAKRYATALRKSGVTVQLKTSAGSVENFQRITDPQSGVSLTLIQGGIAPAGKHDTVVSLGRMFLEPLWVFYRSAETIDRLPQLRGRRIAIGPEGSGTRPLALSMLKVNDLDATNVTLSPLSGEAAAKALDVGDIDAVFLVMSPESPLVQVLLRNSSIKLMNFAQAEAYTRILPYLNRIVLPEGVVDLVGGIPARDVAMLAPATALVASEKLHPALVGLLVEAAKDIHGTGGLFQRIGDFPKPQDPEFEISDDAMRFYKSGPPFLQRYLPFWLASFVERMSVLVLPLITLLFPVAKLGPAIYRWSIKRRLFFWYDRLKRLEDRVRHDVVGALRAAHTDEIHEIEDAVAAIPVPLAYTDQFYSLRAAIDLVRQRLTNRLPGPAASS